jgi:hypothetical protein
MMQGKAMLNARTTQLLQPSTYLGLWQLERHGTLSHRVNQTPHPTNLPDFFKKYRRNSLILGQMAWNF